ncbi:MAG TPA: CPBP family glutamic-type intramembrane protease [Planctomycetota bacterium]|nr:CPBP family glutamic-type intramembrane protease [Planctomycetota bacterium]
MVDAKAAFIAVAAPPWVLYVFWRARGTPGQLREWGIRADTFKPAAIACAAAGLPALAAMTVYGFVAGNLPPPWSFWVILAIYPAWGLVQQFLLNAILASNLRTLLPAWATVPMAAVLFGLAHAPDWALVGLTGAAGLMWVPIYLWRPNLWMLGLAHGILGAVAYYAVLGRDAWVLFTG